MSPQRTVADVERSLEASRAELASALGDLRAGIARASDVRGQAERHATEARERLEQLGRDHAERYATQARARIESIGRSDELARGALAVGFVVGGGVSGALYVPVKLTRVAIGLPPSANRMERAMRQDKYSKQVGRAIAGIAAADRQMRSRRARLWRLVRPTPRRILMLGSLGGGLFVSIADEETRTTILTETRALLEAIGGEVTKRLDAI